MTTDGRARLAAMLPLRIDRCAFEDPILQLGGDDWSLSTLCPWRWIDAGGRLVSHAGEDAADAVWDLVGHTVVDVVWTDAPGFGGDPSLRLEGGGRIDLFSDAPFETWSIGMPGLVLVGPLLDQE